MIDLKAIKEKWINQCGACDVGIGECNHPAEDYRPVMLALVRELEGQRRDEKRNRSAAVHLHDPNTDRRTHRECQRAGWRCIRCRHDHEVDPGRVGCYACTYTVLAPTWVMPELESDLLTRH